jgi:hypothetical protein
VTADRDLVAGIIAAHFALPHTEDGVVLIVDCGDEDCGFQSSHVEAVGHEAMVLEHARHVADLLAAAGIRHVSAAVAEERLRLADRLDAEGAYRDRTRWPAWNLDRAAGWQMAANHLRHPTATAG